MRALLAASAMTIGSVAFQLALQAGWFNGLTWAAPWAWGLSAALWMWWLISHPKIEKEWLKAFHLKVGRGIHPIRALLCLIVLIIISLWITSIVHTHRYVPASVATTREPDNSAPPLQSDGQEPQPQAPDRPAQDTQSAVATRQFDPSR
jgi:hypothetical protein